jgi:hypothetical protein
MAGLSDTLASPRPPLAIRLCSYIIILMLSLIEDTCTHSVSLTQFPDWRQELFVSLFTMLKITITN